MRLLDVGVISTDYLGRDGQQWINSLKPHEQSFITAIRFGWELSTRQTIINRRLKFFQLCLAVYNTAHHAGVADVEKVKVGDAFPAINLQRLCKSMEHK